MKIVLVFPYAFVDTSEAWFEPRRRRIAISAAGPLSDFAVGGAFAVASLLSGPGTMRDIEFQVALGAYLGALFNLSPMLDRDGYHILIDVVRRPNLRAQARAWLAPALPGGAARPAARRHLRRRDYPVSIVSAVRWRCCATTTYSALRHGARMGLLGSFFRGAPDALRDGRGPAPAAPRGGPCR
jgi:hypothetical protein